MARRVRRVDEYPAAGFESGRDCRTDQGLIQHDDVVGLIDQVSIRDRLVGVPAKSLDGCPGTFGCIESKGLYRQALEKPRCGDQLGEGHPALAAAAMDPDFNHYVTSRPVN